MLSLNTGRALFAWMATFAIAALSYRYIEAPLLRFKSRPPRCLLTRPYFASSTTA